MQKLFVHTKQTFTQLTTWSKPLAQWEKPKIGTQATKKWGAFTHRMSPLHDMFDKVMWGLMVIEKHTAQRAK
jgi:hypothetical protein